MTSSFFYYLCAGDYERQVTVGAARRLTRLLGTRMFRHIESKPPGGSSDLCHFLSQYPIEDWGEEQNAIDDKAFYDALLVDLVYQFEFEGGEPVLAAGEASVTVETHDVERARRRAAAIEKMTGTTTLPFVIGAVITREAIDEAERPGETQVRWLQMDEAPEDG